MDELNECLHVSIVDVVVLLITVTICIDMLLSGARSTIWGKDISDTRAGILSDVLKVMITVITLYVGSKLNAG